VSKSCFYIFFLIFLFCNAAFAQTQNSLTLQKDTVVAKNAYADIVAKHSFLNVSSKPVSFPQSKRLVQNRDYIFYLISFLLFTIALFRLLNDKYYLNMTRVFFNSSLRQSQLVEQLLLDKQASLVMNLFFVLVMGLYLFQLLIYFAEASYINAKLLGICMLAVLSVYGIKYVITLFFGWITGYSSESENYVFIVFLLNKMLSLFMLPVIVVMAYVDQSLASTFIQFSFFIIGLMFFIRYFRVFGMLQYKLKVSRLHFLLYVAGVEILPLLIIYKSSMIILTKNL
jgi:hypothetical protein